MPVANRPDRRAPLKREPEVYARALGAVEFVCPHCGRFQKAPTVNWRRPSHQCTNKKCRRVVNFGLIFGHRLVELPPLSARLVQRSEARLANYEGPLSDRAARGIGQVVGPIEYWCPSCGARNVQKPDQFIGEVACESCHSRHFVGLALFYATRAHRETPADWIPPYRGN